MVSRVSLWVTLVALSVAGGQLCYPDHLPRQCLCLEHAPATFMIVCSCSPGEALNISETATRSLPFTTTSFHIHNCSDPVTILPNALQNQFHLENITFHNISQLTLKNASLDIYHFEKFMLSFNDVSNLSIEQNAIKLQKEPGHNRETSLIIQNTTITNLKANAIKGSLSKLQMEHVILSQTPESQAIHVGAEGTVVFISFLHTFKQLSSEWIRGNVSKLSIVNSSLNLQSNTFAGVTMQASPFSSFSFHNNLLGNFPEYPSLPTKALNLKIQDLKNINATDNRITCRCQDITWLREDPMTEFKSIIKESLKCKEGNIASAIARCGPLTNSGHTSPMYLILHLIAASWILLIFL